MKIKDILFENEAIEKLTSGLDKLNKAVKSTLGPAGRNVIIEGDYEELKSTKDGVTVAKSIKLKDPVENMGAQLVKEAASQTGDEAGDGTTTSTVLASSVIKQGLKVMDKGANPVEIKKGIERAVKDVVSQLFTMKTDIKDTKEIEQVGTISSNNDKEVGKLISEAMEEVGIEGVITVEESKTGGSYLEMVEGMQLPKGYLSPYFINNNSNMQWEAEEAYILLYDKKITELSKGLVNLLEKVIHENKPLLIVADDVSGAALAGLVVNKTRGTISTCAVKAPDFGERKQAVLEDLAILTGGTVLSPDKGLTLDKLEMSQLGKARMVTVNNKQTTIVDGAGDTDKISNRVDEIKTLIEKADSDFEKEKLQERLAKLSGGIAILNIGAETETGMKEKKDRVDDALHATKAAVEEGIIPGGGVALMNVYESYKEKVKEGVLEQLEHEDQMLGYKIVFESIKEPFMAIMSNAGENGEAVWQRIQVAREKTSNEEVNFFENISNVGIDARTQDIVDLVDAGIIDPLKVTRIALEKAASVAVTFLITDCVITNSQDEKDEDEQQPNMMGMM